MTPLQDLIRTLDDAALSAFGSDGLLRRAKAAMEGPDSPEVIAEEARAAQISVGPYTVRLDAAGLQRAICDCPATATCRHMLMAALALRDRPAGGACDPQSDTAPVAPSALDEIAALSLPEIEAFAGTDWPEAVRLAKKLPVSVPDGSGASCTVPIGDGGGEVVFLARGGLSKALFRGPAAQRRRAVAAAALALGRHPLPDGVAIAYGVDPGLLDQAEAALLGALAHGLRGDPTLAEDRLYDIALSARADAAPRLAGLLRSAAHQAGRLSRRDPAADPLVYLAILAEAHALLRALRRAPEDPVLCGTLRRTYLPGPPLDLAILGVSLWGTAEGARGVTIHGWDGARYLASGPARAAGADPTFSARHAYQLPWWGAPTPSRMTGRQLHFSAPDVSVDGLLSGTSSARVDDTSLTLAGLPVHPTWGALLADVAARRGIGLRTTTRPLPALIAVTAAGKPEISVLNQTDTVDLGDRQGLSCPAVLPDARIAAQVHEMQDRIKAALVEVSGQGDGLRLTLVSVYHGDPLQIWNVTADPPPKATQAGRALQALRRGVAWAIRPALQPPTTPPRLQDLSDRALLAVCAAVQAPAVRPPPLALAEEAAALGLSRLAGGLVALDGGNGPACLALAWQIALLRRAAG